MAEDLQNIGALEVGRRVLRTRAKAERILERHGLTLSTFLRFVMLTGCWPSVGLLPAWLECDATVAAADAVGINLPDVDWGALIVEFGPLVAEMFANCMG